MDVNLYFKDIKASGLRLTNARKSVIEVLLEDKDISHTSDEIHRKICEEKGQACDLVSIYRILTKFSEIGLTEKVDFNNEASRYKIHDKNQHLGHVHYFKCTNCYSIEPFSGCIVSKIEKELEAKGCKNLSHHLEISGLCPKCSSLEN